ncbi:DEAD/DEAH box helicase [Lysinibacillus sp. FSL H8-0500]|uniref:DEAD/DEAH box helicase n=1 Tax=Lysinibacillus sp. FSL H8-0500 TaxID=2921393 RepID=UPI00310184F8
MKSASKKKNLAVLKVKDVKDDKELYLHQKEAMMALDHSIMNKDSKRFAGLVVLPTGGGKTETAVRWVLKNVINQNRKVIWLAHRRELIEQAFASVEKNAITALIDKRKYFNCRIISGEHGSASTIECNDDFIIASKDSLYRGLYHFEEKWLKYHKEVFLIIDEAHRATAKTYRKIMESIDKHAKKFQIVGLTATPFRSAQHEKGLLKKVFKNDIVYQVSLRTLISRGILAQPILKTLQTHINVAEDVSEEEAQLIEKNDTIPSDIAKFISKNKVRNNRIVQEYIDHKDEYGKTLIFAVSQTHAVVLNTLFQERGIRSEYVISNGTDIFGKSIIADSNKEKIKRFKENELDVLINVNILTEGTDIPDTQTVFLTRPTTSEILMTQMVGRALRGELAGGTKNAYIVSFVDDWQNKIAWVTPEKLYVGQGVWQDCENNPANVQKLLPLKQIEQLAKLADDTVDTTALEKVEFIKTVPLGFYSFSLERINEDDSIFNKSCEVLVYEDNKTSFEKLMHQLTAYYSIPDAKGAKKLKEIFADAEDLSIISFLASFGFYSSNDSPTINLIDDVKDIVSYFEVSRTAPPYIEFKEREQVDICGIAQKVYDLELGGKKKKEYIDEVWGSNSFLQAYFNHNKLYFRKAIDTELLKLEEPELYSA